MLQAVNFNRSRRYTRQNLLSIWRTVNLIALYNGLMMIWATAFNPRDAFIEFALERASEPYLRLLIYGLSFVAEDPIYLLYFFTAFLLQLGLLVLPILVTLTFVRIVRPDVFSGEKQQRFTIRLALWCCCLFFTANPYRKEPYLTSLPDIGYFVTMAGLVSIVFCEITELRSLTRFLLPPKDGMPKNNQLGVASILLSIFGFFQAVYWALNGSLAVRRDIVVWINAVTRVTHWSPNTALKIIFEDIGLVTCLVAMALGVVGLFRRNTPVWQGYVVPAAGIGLSIFSMIIFRFPNLIHDYIPHILWVGIW